MGSYYNAVKVNIGSIEVVENILNDLEPKPSKVLLLTRGGDFSKSQAMHILSKCLGGFEVEKLELEISNPDVEDLYSYFQQVKAFNYQCIVGIGGGSVLDLAKSLAALKGMEIDSIADLRTVIEEKVYKTNQNIIPWVGIPTTSGTGSEVTCWATIWDRANSVKLSIDSESIYANTAIIDPSLTRSLPTRLTASTALDALCHATESYWSKNSNEISRVYALEAIKRIVLNIEKVVNQPNDITVRKEIALGSLYAGLAFSNTRTTASHSISYPLTLELGIDHGIAASLTLAKVMELNFEAITEKDKLLHAFGVKNCQEVQTFIEHIHRISGFSSRLKDYNANLEIIDVIASNAFTKGRMDNNPIAFTKHDVTNILMSIY
ncbi:phosphonoacetaldehyde reductase [Virgibacillus sp. Bac330]|uniref:phosphonoacetaldehyde reductase n=1 Tax=Virgibacillus sp. Bac330 TaxID=2419841 RepID=UPI000EF4BC34|nr:phosphonoacetaldehyde reductase [Virgibacillus sp. Bac330]